MDSGDELMAPLLTALAEGDSPVWQGAAEALARRGPAAVPPLCELLRDARPHAMVRAIAVLARIGDSSALEAVVETLRSPEPHVRGAGAEALGAFGEAAAAPLAELLDDPDWSVACRAITSLQRVGPPAVPALVPALRDGSWRVRREAARALGEIGDARAVHPLWSLLRCGYEDVLRDVAESLAKLGDVRAVLPLLEVFHGLGGQPAAGGDDRPGHLPPEHALAESRLHAVRVLGEMGHPGAVPLLNETLLEIDWCLRGTAAEALGRIGDPEAIEPLCRALEAEHGFVRERAAVALRQIAARHSVRELRQALPVLRRLLRPWNLEGEPARSTYAAALREIERATAALKDLPLPASRDQDAATRLPLPAAPPEADPRELPLPAEAGLPASTGQAPFRESRRALPRLRTLVTETWRRVGKKHETGSS